MAANTAPIFVRGPDTDIGGSIFGPSAQTGTVPSQGIDSNTVALFQADTTEGSFVDSIILKPMGSPAATVARIYLCNVTGSYTAGTSNTTSTVSLLAELSLAAVTASATAA